MNHKPKILGVIGHPITHSLSPLMHNAALAQQKLAYVYEAFDVAPKNLKRFLKKLRTQEIHGLNVTIPHKETVISSLDQLTPAAKQIGAVNTIYKKGHKLIGHNTDASGYLKSLGKSLKGKHIIILGAGGAARAIVWACGAEKAKSVTILNRTLDRAVKLAGEFSKIFKQTKFTASTLNDKSAPLWKPANLIVNATSMGLKKTKMIPLPWSLISKTTLFSDLVYTPRSTPFLKAAQKMGYAHRHEGWGMLLHQGALAYELWTKHKAPVSIMQKALLEELT